MRISYVFDNYLWYFSYCGLIKFTFSDVFPTARPVFVNGREERMLKHLYLIFKNV